MAKVLSSTVAALSALIGVAFLVSALVVPLWLPRELQTPLGLGLGLAGLVLLWIAAVSIAAALGLAQANQALGLPVGSVRAILGLLLSLGFLAVLVLVLTEPTSVTTTKRTDLRAIDVLALERSSITYVEQFGGVSPGTEPVNGPVVPSPLGEAVWRSPTWVPDTKATFNVLVRTPGTRNDKLVDTLVTTLSTLLASVVSFYFGSKSNGITTAGSPAPTVQTWDRKKRKAVDVPLAVTGTGLRSALKAILSPVNSDKVFESTSVVTSGELVLFYWSQEPAVGPHKLTIEFANGGKREGYDVEITD